MNIKQVIYGAPPSDTPSGGVKVIYQHSEILNKIGITSGIWHPSDELFQCSWFDNNIRKVKLSNINPHSDFIVIPEIWATSHLQLLKDAGFKVGVFVQNCYLTHFNLSDQTPVFNVYKQADLILSISEDTTKYLIDIFKVPPEKIVLQRYSINHDIFFPRQKDKLITFMPRKMSDHSTRVIHALSNLIDFNYWKIEPIHNMNESQVADKLSRSIIFLAFSEFEGLPVPPVEAALCGNFVIGYDGQGGHEYWHQPNFQKVEQGNIQHFVSATINTINSIESNSIPFDGINNGISSLASYFSKENEISMLQNFIKKIHSL